MTHPLLPSTNAALKQRLLTGASAAVIVLALAVAAPSGAMAQSEELTGTVGTPGVTGTDNVIDNGDSITNTDDDNAGVDDAGAVDVHGGVDVANVTIQEDGTLFVFDGTNGGPGALSFAAGPNQTFVVGNDDTFTINLGMRDEDDQSLEEIGAVNIDADQGINGGSATDRGGNLTLTSDQDAGVQADMAITMLGAAGFQTILMNELFVLGGAGVAANANATSNVNVTIGVDTQGDMVDVNVLRFAGGTGSDGDDGGGLVGQNGGGSTSVINADMDVAALQVRGGAGGNADAAQNGGAGGAVDLTVDNEDNTSEFETIEVTAGNGGTGDAVGSTGGNGGNATLTFENNTVVVSANTVSITGATDGVAGDGTGGMGGAALFELAGNLTANNITLTDNDGGATLTLNGGAVQTINGLILAGAGGDGTVVVNNTGPANVTFESDIGSSATRFGTLDLDQAATVEFNGDLFVTNITTAGLVATVQFDGDVDATGITSGADTTVLDFNGNLTIGGGNLVLGDGGATFAGNVDGTGFLQVDTNDDATFDGASGQAVDIAIVSNGAGAGDITIANISADGVIFNSTIGAAGNEVGTIGLLTADANATFNDTVFGLGLTLIDGASITINDQGATATPMVTLTGDEGLSLATSTINLGREVGADDIVFQLTQGGGVETVFAAGDDETTVNLAANFLTGDLTLIDDDVGADQAPVADQITVTQTALTTFTEDTTSTAGDLIITAAARSAADTADLLGVSTEDAVALRQAVISTDATGDDATLDALTAALNAGENSPSAALAARTVGTQEDTLGGGSEAAFQMFGEQTGMLTARLEDMRSQSGFSGGDLDAPYSPQTPSSSGGVWGQAFGGIANADGDTNFAGWDAAYGGMMIGVDGSVSEDFTLGAFGSFAYTSVEGDGPANADIEASTFGFGVYAGYAGEGFYLDSFAAYAMSENDLTRTATAGAVTQTLSADYDASQFSVGLAGGVPIEMSSNVFITPNASLTWNHYDADTYTETGGSLAQTVNPGSVSNLTGTIGARIHAVYENFDNDGTVFIPELRVALIGDLVDDDATAMATFAGTGVTAYQVTGTDTDDIGALIGVGFGLDNPDWAASINYDADLRGDFMSHTARAEFRWKF